MPVNTAQFDALVARFEAAGKNAKKELGRALSNSQRAAKAEFTRATRLAFNVKVANFQRHLKVGEADQSRLTYKIDADDKGLSVTAFNAKQNAVGLIAKITKDGTPTVFAGGFFPSKGTKTTVPFKRDGSKRLPISVVRGPSAGDMIALANVQEAALKKTKERLNTDIEKRINRIVTGG